MKYETLTDACHAYVDEMDAIPESVIEKLMSIDETSITEITPPSIGDRVYITGPDWKWEEGEIIETNYDGENDLYVVKLDKNNDEVIVCREELEIMHESVLPMWGTMFVPNVIDQEWITGKYCESHLQEVANLGFRIFESEDFGLLLGIDGAGYDFFSAHWIPLYKLRGIHWHEVDDTVKETA